MQFFLKKFEEPDARALVVREIAEGGEVTASLDAATARFLETSEHAWSLLSDDGQVWACGGLIEQWHGRYSSWLWCRYKMPTPAIRALIGVSLKCLGSVQGRIESTARADFPQALRLMNIFGFTVENPPGVLKNYGPDGADHIAFVRHNE